jgi:cytochrome c biogenesis protein CcmG, thiol:disulfide interchange protein DsbE
MDKAVGSTASQNDVGVSRRGLVLGAIGVAGLGAVAGVTASVWTEKDLTARFFNPFKLDHFDLAAVPGLTRPDGAAVPGFSSADLAGRRSILNIWASWCPSCREEHMLLVDLAARDLVPIYGADVKDAPEHARDFLSRHGNPYRAVGADSHAFLQRALGVRGVPATFVVAPGPVIEVAIFGPLDPDIIEEKIIPALTKTG